MQIPVEKELFIDSEDTQHIIRGICMTFIITFFFFFFFFFWGGGGGGGHCR